MRRIAIEWKKCGPAGHLEVLKGELTEMSIARGQGSVNGMFFEFGSCSSPCRLVIRIETNESGLESSTPLVTVHTSVNAFSFFLCDVQKDYPIIIPEYGVVVTEADDDRSYEEIEKQILGRKWQTKMQRIESEEEENYEKAAAHTRAMTCPTWLGLSRDMRIFEVGFRRDGEAWDWVQPRFHGFKVTLPDASDSPVRYNFHLGRGISCEEKMLRHLEDGVLPILCGTIADGDICYNFTAFVTLESSRLSSESLRGTHFLVADGQGIGHTFSEEQEAMFKSLLPTEMNQNEETVLYFKAEAINKASVPRYAWFKAVYPTAPKALKWSFESSTGFGIFESGQVFCVSRLNKRPMSREETAVLINPGDAIAFEFLLPHRPISKERATRLAEMSLETRLAECRDFWKQKLSLVARMEVPEQRISEMISAGLLHLDLVAYGLEPAGTVAATIGPFCPIGSESAPIIQFLDSIGWHDLTRRSLMYFLDKQRKDGSMQNFGRYTLETGAALWSIGEHYRYTREDAWIQEIKLRLLKACEYLLKWRRNNQQEELRGKGFGMLDGKVADPEDPFHSFMLNGYAYMGLIRVAEVLDTTDPVQSKRLKNEAEEFKKDIRTALHLAMARSPVVPLGDGTWCPTAPPWAEGRGPVSLFVEGKKCFSHGSFFTRDSLLGPLYLIFQEIVEPMEQVATWLIKYHTELMFARNVAFSQPYYSCHPWVHLKRAEVKPFLKAYYNTMAGLADRETYTFWEHFFHGSPHKTHEEGWFLMQTRWMLYMEEGHTLELLRGIPRVWMEDGKRIELNRSASYFGPISLKVESRLTHGIIEAQVECASDRQPECVELRLPHPECKKAVTVEGGIYDPETETVRIAPFRNSAKVTLTFDKKE